MDTIFGKNPANAAMPYYGAIPGRTQPYQEPWFNAGKNMLPQLTGEYGNLMSDPGGRINKIGESYKESPGYRFAMQQALQGAGHAAAAGGMAGSPEHEQRNMQLSNDIASQDYNKWMSNALGEYNQGLSGGQNISGQGQQSGKEIADMIAHALAQQGILSYQGQSQSNQNRSDLIHSIAQALGSILGGFGGGS